MLLAFSRNACSILVSGEVPASDGNGQDEPQPDPAEAEAAAAVIDVVPGVALMPVGPKRSPFG